jgi:hypothetical protein
MKCAKLLVNGGPWTGRRQAFHGNDSDAEPVNVILGRGSLVPS